MIDAIYASKLYKVSKRKSAIVSAANDPINTELVTQLADALSPVYKKEKYLVDERKEEAKAKAEEAREAEEAKEDSEIEREDEKELKSADKAPAKRKSSNLADSFRKAERHEREDLEREASPVSEEEPETVEDSTSAEGTSITATRLLTQDTKQLVDEIKGLLNLQDTTTGVNRILVKDSELWIYYNDSINLNNVMANVIEALNAAGYVYLEFNRLARSDNAMVFQIMYKDTDARTMPIDSEEEE